MQRINQYLFYQLGNVVRPLSELQAETTISDNLPTLYGARSWLEFLLQDRVIPLVVCKTAGRELVADIDAVLPDFNSATLSEDLKKKLERVNVYNITNHLKVFENVLSAEVQTLDTYFVSQKGAFATRDLIDRAELIFPEGIRKVLPEPAIHDTRQAGRALVFDLPTAAGFHIVRATESVIRLYYEVVLGNRPKKRDWGTYIDDLKKAKADSKVLAAIDQMRSLHRNPLIHPEDVLSEEDALVLFGIALSAIVAMVSDIQRRRANQPTASAAAASA